MGKGGNGKGQETHDQKTARLDQEFEYLQRVRNNHLSNGEDYAPAYDKGGKSKGKGKYQETKGKGKDKSSSSGSSSSSSSWRDDQEVQRLRKENKELKEKNRSRSPTPRSRKGGRSGKDRVKTKSKDRSRSRSSSSTGSSHSNQGLTAQQKEERKAAKKIRRQEERRQRLEKKEVDPTAEPRPTIMCTSCTFEGTYANSKRCYLCKEPFNPTEVAPSAQAAIAPAPESAAYTACLQNLQSCTSAAAARTASYAEVTKKSVAFAANTAGLPPPPPPPALKPAAPTSAAATAEPPTPTPNDPAAIAEEDAKSLTNLRVKRAAADSQRIAFAGSKIMIDALTLHVQELDTQIQELLQKRHQELQPHQVGLLLSQRQHELNMALRKVADVDKSAKDKVAANEAKEVEIAQGYDKEIEALNAAKSTALQTMLAERTALETQRVNDIAAAQLDVEVLRHQVNSLHNRTNIFNSMDVTGAPAPTPTITPAPTPTSAPLPMTTIPGPTEIPEEDLDRYAFAMRVLDHHQMQDVEFPLRYDCIAFDPKAVAKIVGSTVWLAAYPASTEAPKSDQNIPKRVLGTFRVALTRLAIDNEARENIEESRVTTAMETAAKHHAAGGAY